MRIRKGDKVLVIAGKDKGVQGEVLQTAPRVKKILVEGVNLVKKHIKAQETKKGGKVGQRIELPTFINVSNAKLVCPNCGKATRVGYEVVRSLDSADSARDDKKYRVCKKCGKRIEEKAK